MVGAEVHAVVAQRVDALVGGEVLEGVLDAPATAQEVHEAGRGGGELGGQDLEHDAVGFHDAELAGRAVAGELDDLIRDPVVAPGAVVEGDPAAPWGGVGGDEGASTVGEPVDPGVSQAGEDHRVGPTPVEADHEAGARPADGSELLDDPGQVLRQP